MQVGETLAERIEHDPRQRNLVRRSEYQRRQPIKRREGTHGEAPERQLADVVRLPPDGCEPAPEQQHDRHQREAGEAVHGLHPGDGHVPAQHRQVDVIAHPQVVCVPFLGVDDPVQRQQRHQQEKCHDGLALGSRQPRARGGGAGGLPGRKPCRTGRVEDEPEQHAEPGEAEAIVPAVALAEGPGDQWRDEHADVDHRIVDLDRVRAARIALVVERADLRDQVAAQEPGPEDQQQQREQERLVEGHAEMTEGHQPAAEDDRVASPEHPIAHESAEDGREVDQADVEPEGLRREGLDRQRPGDRLEQVPIGLKADDPFDVARQQQLFGHVEREQGHHAVERDALPQLSACKRREPAGVAEEIPG